MTPAILMGIRLELPPLTPDEEARVIAWAAGEGDVLHLPGALYTAKDRERLARKGAAWLA